jgi:hypothetical protein
VSEGLGAQLAIAGLCAAGFTIALVALVSSQLALMSVLNSTRAERAADQIAASRFTADVIEKTVERAVQPVAGAEIASQLAVATSNDPRVLSVVSTALVSAHRQVADPEATRAELIDGNAALDQAIVQSVIDTAATAGIDLQGLGADMADVSLGGIRLADAASQAGVQSVVPSDVPNLGLRRVAETTRIIALLAMVLLGFVAVFSHPRPGRSLRRLGWSVAIVCGSWLGGLLVVGWIIGRTSKTLFGEMLDTVWSDAVPSMLLLVGAGLIIGVGLWVAGTAFDGFDSQRHRELDLPY